MLLHVTAIYGAISGLLAVGLSVAVILKRRETRISLMHGDDPDLIAAIRRHANFSEYVPLALILMLIAEAGGAGTVFLHAVGGVLLTSRILHIFGIRANTGRNVFRIMGMAGTLSALAVLSIYIAAMSL